MLADEGRPMSDEEVAPLEELTSDGLASGLEVEKSDGAQGTISARPSTRQRLTSSLNLEPLTFCSRA